MIRSLPWTPLTSVLVSGTCLLLLTVTHAQPPDLVLIGEGVSSANAQQGIDVSYRRFSPSSLTALCATVPVVSSMVARGPIDLEVGRPFPLTALVVLVLDSETRAVGPVPIAVEVQPLPMLNLQGDSVIEGRLLPIRPGHFMFLVRTLCPGPRAATTVPAVVWNR